MAGIPLEVNLRFSAALVVSLLVPTLLHAQNPQAPATAFPITVHVVTSRWLSGGGQQFDAEIDGQQVELTNGERQGILALGDYPARIAHSVHSSGSPPNTYDIYRGYDLLLPDGKTRTYTVTGLGPASVSH